MEFLYDYVGYTLIVLPFSFIFSAIFLTLEMVLMAWIRQVPQVTPQEIKWYMQRLLVRMISWLFLGFLIINVAPLSMIYRLNVDSTVVIINIALIGMLLARWFVRDQTIKILEARVSGD